MLTLIKIFFTMRNGYSLLVAVGSVILSFGFVFLTSANSMAQEHSVAKEWNEVLLQSIRNDFARPTVHARNLWHSSILMYDCFAAYDPESEPYFLGREVSGFECQFDGVPTPEDVQAAQEEAMSYAMYRLILHQFVNAPGIAEINFLTNQLMADLGYDPDFTSTDYTTGNPAALGNYIVEQMIEFGLQDGSNEQMDYGNTYYFPVNDPLDMGAPGNPDVVDVNRWQPLVVEGALDQAGNPVNPILDFLSPEWGDVVHFALDEDDLTVKQRDGFDWNVYVDPGDPPYLDEGSGEGLESLWKWGHILVAIWQSHHDPSDGVIWDASPNTMGNNPELPTTFEEFLDFYDFFEGGDASQGYDVNPATGEPYEEQLIPRADYARILAEFWADGPDSETPPGHWFTILNEVNDHPMLEKRWNGQGPVLSDLEWDVKTYFTLGSGMHDAAVAAWSVKGFYDYSRPVSAIRHMAEMGQCSDPMLPNYHPDGFPLIPGYIELIEPGDELAGDNDENVNEIKLFTWRGPDFIDDPLTDAAGVGWILAKNWWPYQRPTFVTPPFAGYVSGHSTYSRTAAEIMTLMTGDPYFPGGMSQFPAPQNEFLVFEEGPSVDVELQWATYVDASDQCSLSRIWGGIHPPADDIPGRIMGKHIGPKVYEKATSYFTSESPRVATVDADIPLLNEAAAGGTFTLSIAFDQNMDTSVEPVITYPFDDPLANSLFLISENWSDASTFELVYDVIDANEELDNIYVQITDAVDPDGNTQEPFVQDFAFEIDTRAPEVVTADAPAIIADAQTGGTVSFTYTFDEDMAQDVDPQINFTGGDPLVNSLTFNALLSNWNDNTYQAVFNVADADEELVGIGIELVAATDEAGNMMQTVTNEESLIIDTRNPLITEASPSATLLADADAGSSLQIDLVFDESMNPESAPVAAVTDGDPFSESLSLDEDASGWNDASSYSFVFTLNDAEEEFDNLEFTFSGATDIYGNEVSADNFDDFISIDTRNPEVQNATVFENLISDNDAGPEGLSVEITFDEAMNTDVLFEPVFSEDTEGSFVFNTDASTWSDAFTLLAVFDVVDENVEIDDLTITISDAQDEAGNALSAAFELGDVSIDTRNPQTVVLSANDYVIDLENVGDGSFSILAIFDENMNQNIDPFVLFPVENPNTTITLNSDASGWLNNTNFETVYNVSDAENTVENIDVVVTGAIDLAGNLLVQAEYTDFFDIDMTTVGVDGISEDAINLFPNPVSGGQDLMLTLGKSSDEWNIALFSGTGQMVGDWQSVRSENGLFRIPTAELAAGVYLIAISNEDKNHTIRFEVVR